jgi:hypothetical protein
MWSLLKQQGWPLSFTWRISAGHGMAAAMITPVLANALRGIRAKSAVQMTVQGAGSVFKPWCKTYDICIHVRGGADRPHANLNGRTPDSTPYRFWWGMTAWNGCMPLRFPYAVGNR